MKSKDKKAHLSITRRIGIILCIALEVGLIVLMNDTKALATDNAAQTGAFTIEAKRNETGGILISWEDWTEPATYQVQCSVENENAFTDIIRFENVTGKQSYTDNNVTSGVAYYYKVIKIINGQVVAESPAVLVKYGLAAPESVSIKKAKSGNSLLIKWTKVNSTASYEVYRMTNGGKAKKITTTKKSQYTDEKVKAGNLYTYYVVATDGEDVVSGKSEEAYKLIEAAEFNVNAEFTGKKKEKLTWDKVPAASSYIVYKKNASGKYVKVGQTEKTYYTDSDIKKGKAYKYKVSYLVELPDGSTIEKKSSVLNVYASTIDPNKKMIAITFDDGPGRYTQEIVDCLKKNDARATFFVLGCNVDNYKSAVKNAHKIGCEIGNHSYDHKILTRLSAKDVAKQMADTDAKIKKVTGSDAAIMRCPGGGYNKTVQGAVGKPLIMWSIDTLDWKTRNTDKTISAVMNNVKDGDIILMHDIHEPTKRAALYLIPQLKKKGYQLVTVSELAKYRGHTLKKGNVYFNLRKKK